MFTIAHEMGHAMHSYLAHREQEYRYAGYTIFIAEIASTLNEALLLNHLLKITTDNKRRAYLLTHYADNFRGTLFVQTLFAEFEKIIHELAEQGVPLTVDKFNEVFYSLHQQYYGNAVVLDRDVEIGWMRIPHFYSSFYVYKYATGFSAANSFCHRILRNDPGSVEAYLGLLKSGGKDYSLNLLKTAGVDMTTSSPIMETLSVFESIVKELKDLL
jgi:oligoendopeptidase F